MNYKTILGIVAAGALLVLQIINVLLSNDIEHVLDRKADLMELKASDIQKVLEALSKNPNK